MAAYLYCIAGPYAGQEFELDQAGVVIGRDSTCANIILASTAISRKHARVFETHDGRVGVEDFDSSNGTFAKTQSGRRKISGVLTLDNGDRLIIGPGEEYVFEVRCPEPSIDEAVTRRMSPNYVDAIKNKANVIKESIPENLVKPKGGLYDQPMKITEAWLATPLQRLGARFVDGAIASVCFTLTFLFSGVNFGSILYFRNLSAGLWAAAGSLALGYLLYIAVQVYFLWTAGQTIGKKMMGIRIARLDGRKASFWAILFIRMLAFFILTLIPFIGWALSFINLCFIFRSDRRMLHDFLAGTVVLKVPSNF